MKHLILDLSYGRVYENIKVEYADGQETFDINQANLNIIKQNIIGWLVSLEYKPFAYYNNSITLTGNAVIPVYLAALSLVKDSFYEVRYKNKMYDVVIA